MSVQRRKLSYWSIEFASGDEHHFDSQLFCRFLNYANCKCKLDTRTVEI